MRIVQTLQIRKKKKISTAQDNANYDFQPQLKNKKSLDLIVFL